MVYIPKTSITIQN